MSKISIYKGISVVDMDITPDNWHKIQTIDMHVGGEPLRIVVDGIPNFAGDSIQAIFEDACENYQTFRTRLIHEPRGHKDMYGAILLDAYNEDSDYNIIFMDAHDYTPMCGHGIIAVTTYLAMQYADDQTQYAVRYNTPAGKVTAQAIIENHQVTQVTFTGVPSYNEILDWAIDIPTIGKIQCDVAYGGERYAIVDTQALNVTIHPSHTDEFIHLGRIIKQAVQSATPSFKLYGVIFTESQTSDGIHSRNINVFGDGSIDRSPTGTGLCARLAVLIGKQQIILNQTIKVSSITGAIFKGEVVGVKHHDGRQYYIPTVTGTAYLIGKHTFIFDPQDKLHNGFLLG